MNDPLKVGIVGCAEGTHGKVWAELLASEAGSRGTVQMIGPRATWYGFTMNLFGANGAGEPIRFEVTYDRLLETIAAFFRTGIEPIPHAVILEKTCIFHAALASAQRASRPVNVARLVAGKGL
jgi:hypothetical protein